MRLSQGPRQAPFPGFGPCPHRTVFRCRGQREILGPRYRIKPRSTFLLGFPTLPCSISIRKPTWSFRNGPSSRVHIRLTRNVTNSESPRLQGQLRASRVRRSRDDLSILTSHCTNESCSDGKAELGPFKGHPVLLSNHLFMPIVFPPFRRTLDHIAKQRTLFHPIRRTLIEVLTPIFDLAVAAESGQLLFLVFTRARFY